MAMVDDDRSEERIMKKAFASLFALAALA